MHIVAINGSPRKNGNTFTLLDNAMRGAADRGAATEIIHLYDLRFTGCVSCFFCRVKGNVNLGRCAQKDDLSPVLEKVMACDALLLGSPIYLHDITAMMRAFIERIIFMNLSYDLPRKPVPGKSIATAFFFTMNVTEQKSREFRYPELFETNTSRFSILGGAAQYMACYDTYQFEDYSRYAAGMFDPVHKKQVRDTQFPLDCRRAYEIGAGLAGAL
ncbi:MAG: NAD(P)H-dependent oxidoreductase [Spirochaetales bacterium]|jgi:multimeric flavodoxin WrbA|nr:NAD(P)H-dependent oxidoreductase [Spirochaetales bacterium]